jgi:two-component system sensor histidine kinase TctE
MTAGTSLRLRLLALTMTPLLLVALGLGAWRYQVALDTAQNLFDRSLLATALAISRDVAISGGDAILPGTRALMNDAGGGEIFYHVTGPGGFYVTGYAYPPQMQQPAEGPVVYGQGAYRGEAVRVLRLTERVVQSGLSGDTVVSVWQRIEDRQRFARLQALQSLRLMGLLLLSLAVLLWFGVARGLRPLTDLEAAIARRNPDDLTPIRRPVPPEVSGIVATLNRLLGQLQDSIAAHQSFISDAAHQLRNPAAATLALAETLDPAKTRDELSGRIADLRASARHSARLCEQLLSLERLKWDAARPAEPIDLAGLVEEICAEEAPSAITAGLHFELRLQDRPLLYPTDPLMFGEALRNLIDNARKHGGASLTAIRVTLERVGGNIVLSVEDDGIGMPPGDAERVSERYTQLRSTGGSGLGLAIVAAFARRNDGEVEIEARDQGVRVIMRLPVAERN